MRASDRRNLRVLTEKNLKTKYRLLFLNEFEFINLDYAVGDYLMNKLLSEGTVAAFNLTSALEEKKDLAFGSYVPYKRDWKGDPYQIKILNEWKHPRVPSDYLKNNENAVVLELGFIPMAFINEYVQRLMDIQATIDTNLVVNKMPFVIKSTDKKTINAIKELLINEQVIWVNDNQFEVLDTKVPYIIDKLSLHKQEVEAELLSVLGIDGVKFEKKAQMTKDEVNANDDEIDAYRKIIRDRMEAFFSQINKVLGHNISIEQDQDEIHNTEENEDDQI